MANYIMDLRRIVGHRPLLQCAASIIIENDQGEVLLGRRTDNLKWGYSGGSIELGETVEECARRELSEEMGLTAQDLEFFMINSGEETHYIYPNGDEVYNVEIVYLCHDWQGIHRRKKGFSRSSSRLEDIPEDISDPILPVIREYKRSGAAFEFSYIFLF